MCLDIQSGKRYLLVVGLMPAGLTPTFVMISISSRSSEDYYAHALPPSALNTAIPVLFISNEAGAPLETKWPLLYQTMAKYFFKADQLITLQITGGRDTVYMPNPQKGIAYDISGNSSGHPEQLINLTGARPVDGRWISSAERLTFYSLVNDQHQQRLCKYTFDEKEDANGTYRVNQASPYYYICKGKSDDDQKVVRVLETECRQTADSSPVSWSILNGFADETRLYLFEENRVHILPLSALNGSFTTTTTATAAASSVDDRLSVSVATHPLSSFIHCPGQPMPTVPPPTTTTTLPSNDSSPTGADKHGSSEVSLGLFIVLGVIILLVLFVIPTVLVFTYLFCCKGGRSKGGSTKRASTGTAGEGNAAAASQASVAKQGTKVNNSAQWSAAAKGGGSKSGSSKRRRKTQGDGSNKTAPNATTSNVSVSGTSGKKSTKSTRRRQKGKGSGRGSGKVAAAAAAGASVMSTKSRGSKQSRQTKTKTPASTSSKKKGSRRKKKKNKKAMGTSNKSTKTVASSRKQKQRSTSKK